MSSEITLNHEEFSDKIQNLVNEKKNIMIYVYGAIDAVTGKSWCPDCETSKPFVNGAKQDIFFKNTSKEIIFVNLPVVRAERPDYTNNKIVKLTRIPSLIYFNKGVELGRLVELELANKDAVDGFFNDAFEA